ncbi:hypothetical protein LTR08_005030 [Meristemomyces frigidus]|nr:hypothetical protein LTR08_005030 [Meristemomyces frigidus]
MKTSTFISLIATIGLGACQPLASQDIITLSDASPIIDAADALCALTAYSESDCHGSSGNNDGSEHTCISTAGRHSFYMAASCPTVVVSVYQVGGCTGVEHSITATGGKCYNVNNGYAWNGANFVNA